MTNTVADDDEGGAVRLSSVHLVADGDTEVELGSATRSPMEWAMAALSFPAENDR